MKQEITISEIKAVCAFLKIDLNEVSITTEHSYELWFYTNNSLQFIFKQLTNEECNIVVPKINGVESYALGALVELFGES